MTASKYVVVHAPLNQEQRDEMSAILDRLVGTPIARTGDIAVEVGGKRYVFSEQSGSHSPASVARDGGTEIVSSKPPYRGSVVKQVAEDGVALVPSKGQGEEFTLKNLAPNWDGLSDVEQRNAGKQFRQSIEANFPGMFDSWTTTDNERHYRRR